MLERNQLLFGPAVPGHSGVRFEPLYEFAIPKIDLPAIGPMLVVMITGMLALIADLLWRRKNNQIVIGVSIVGLLVSAFLLVAQWNRVEDEVIANMVLVDRFGSVAQLLLVGCCLLTLLFSQGYMREKRIHFGEFYALAVWSTGGAMLMATSKNLLVIFLGLEVLSIALYVMAGMSRTENKSEESALKYFLLGAFASGFLLYGIAFMYGATGSLHLDAVAAAVSNPEAKSLLVFGLGLMLVGLSFKCAFVPFHQWTPDVYQGAPTNVTAFMAAISKIAAFAALFRVLEGFAGFQNFWMPALSVVAIITMTVGNLVALTQKDLKRLLGYSSIAHAGYVLVAVLAHFSAPDRVGFGTVLYYLFSYALMTIGSFAIITLVAKGGKEQTRLEDLHGLWKRSPYAAGLMIVFVASLIGIPFTSGFVGKLLIFLGAVDANLTTLAVVLALNSILSIAYYLAMVRAAFVADEGEEISPPAVNAGLRATLTLCAVGVLVGGIMVSPIMKFFEKGSEIGQPVHRLEASLRESPR